MKKTDTLMKVVSALVFCAMAAYLAVSVVSKLIDPVQTALVVSATMSDSSPMSGLVVRDELLISGGAQYIDVIVDDGEKVSAGETIALIYGSESALDRAVRLDSLERDIENVSASLKTARGYSGGDREKSIRDALLDLSASVRSEAFNGVDTQQSVLGRLVFRTEVSDATEDYLRELQQSYNTLLASAAGDTSSIAAVETGTFSNLVDGYEGVSPDFVRDLTPDELREVIAADREIDPNILGKLITSFNWYYVAILDKDAADRLEEGDTVRLSFSRYHSGYLSARVDSLGRAEDGERLVLFSINKALTDMLAVRSVSADLIYSEYQGLRVPLKSLYRYYAGYMTEEDGAQLTAGEQVVLTLGERAYDVIVSEVGSAQPYGDLPDGVKAGSDADTRAKRRVVVFVWPWDDEEAPDFSSGSGVVSLSGGRTKFTVLNYYDYDPETERLCVFTMTGLQAERKKVELVFAGEEYCLLTSEGEDALREGNEVIVQARGLHNGMVFR